jgi:DNA topoisomerase-6 subunit B
MAKKRANLYAKYIPMIAEFCTELSGKKKEPNYKKMLETEIASENKKAVKEANEIENK